MNLKREKKVGDTLHLLVHEHEKTEKAMCSFDVLLGKKMIAGMDDNLGFSFN
jgi:hypothetical protein